MGFPLTSRSSWWHHHPARPSRSYLRCLPLLGPHTQMITRSSGFTFLRALRPTTFPPVPSFGAGGVPRHPPCGLLTPPRQPRLHPHPWSFLCIPHPSSILRARSCSSGLTLPRALNNPARAEVRGHPQAESKEPRGGGAGVFQSRCAKSQTPTCSERRELRDQG